MINRNNLPIEERNPEQAKLEEFVSQQQKLRDRIQKATQEKIDLIKKRTEEELKVIDQGRVSDISKLDKFTSEQEKNINFTKDQSEEAFDLISRILNSKPESRGITERQECIEVEAEVIDEKENFIP